MVPMTILYTDLFVVIYAGKTRVPPGSPIAQRSLMSLTSINPPAFLSGCLHTLSLKLKQCFTIQGYCLPSPQHWCTAHRQTPLFCPRGQRHIIALNIYIQSTTTKLLTSGRMSDTRFITLLTKTMFSSQQSILSISAWS